MPEVAKIKGLDIRDKKIADSTAVTSVAQTDSIRMTTTNGEEVFIARDSFVDAIASVFKSNAKSSITSLFGELTESNVSSVGSINMSNLASVLSDTLFNIVGKSVPNSDLNNADNTGIYRGYSTNYANYPESVSGNEIFIMLVIAHSWAKFQIIGTQSHNMYCRCKVTTDSGWPSWIKI